MLNNFFIRLGLNDDLFKFFDILTLIIKTCLGQMNKDMLSIFVITRNQMNIFLSNFLFHLVLSHRQLERRSPLYNHALWRLPCPQKINDYASTAMLE